HYQALEVHCRARSELQVDAGCLGGSAEQTEQQLYLGSLIEPEAHRSHRTHRTNPVAEHGVFQVSCRLDDHVDLVAPLACICEHGGCAPVDNLRMRATMHDHHGALERRSWKIVAYVDLDGPRD